MKAELKSYEFWVSIVSAIMVVLQSISLKFDVPYIQEAVMGFLGILAVAGIIKKKDPPAGETTSQSASIDASNADSTEEQEKN